MTDNPARTSPSSTNPVQRHRNLDYMPFDIAAELTAANASIHDGRSAQLTPFVLRSGAAAFTYMQGTTAPHGQPFFFCPNQGPDTSTSQPLDHALRAFQPSPDASIYSAEASTSPTSSRGHLTISWKAHEVSARRSSTYDSYFEEFQVRELSVFTTNLKERFGDVLGSANDIGQSIVQELTREFAIVLDQIRDLTKMEQYKIDRDLLKNFTITTLTYVEDKPASKLTPHQCPHDQDRTWQAATMCEIHRRRDLILQQISLLKKSLEGEKQQETELYTLQNPGCGRRVTFLYCLETEMREWERLWKMVNIECEKARLARGRMTTLARLWGVVLGGLGDT